MFTLPFPTSQWFQDILQRKFYNFPGSLGFFKREVACLLLSTSLDSAACVPFHSQVFYRPEFDHRPRKHLENPLGKELCAVTVTLEVKRVAASSPEGLSASDAQLVQVWVGTDLPAG